MKILIPLLTTVILLAGCNTHSIETQPEGKVVVNDQTYTMLSKDYQWEGDNDTKGSPTNTELADEFKNITVKKGEYVKLEIEQNPLHINVTKLNKNGTNEHVKMKDNTIKMPTVAGYYIYELKTTWKKGKETFVFDVNVE